jgi:acyl-coenzyme A synthetase/AMP-(fatty) acid ligase
VAVVASSNSLQSDAIRKEVSQLVPAYMVPGRVDVFEQLPKNANGKIDRRLLKSRYC